MIWKTALVLWAIGAGVMYYRLFIRFGTVDGMIKKTLRRHRLLIMLWVYSCVCFGSSLGRESFVNVIS